MDLMQIHIYKKEPCHVSLIHTASIHNHDISIFSDFQINTLAFERDVLHALINLCVILKVTFPNTFSSYLGQMTVVYTSAAQG